jgi:glycosyltransferase involved in cell wall biosynthesis
VFPDLPLDRVHATYRMPLHKIVIARWLKSVMQRDYGDAEADLVPNSVDKRQFHAPPRGKQARPTVGFIYARVQFKGVDVTLRAIRRLRAAIPDLRVISFGAVRPAGIPDFDQGIEFHHSPPQDKLRDLYAQCDVWITASRSEGFNLPPMEAMACRTPVVATRTGWPEEAIETGKNGVLVDVDDEDALMQGARWVLSLDEPKWREVSADAHATVASSSWENSTALFERALERARERAASGEIAGGR